MVCKVNSKPQRVTGEGSGDVVTVTVTVSKEFVSNS
jgi:hypothetical protein